MPLVNSKLKALANCGASVQLEVWKLVVGDWKWYKMVKKVEKVLRKLDVCENICSWYMKIYVYIYMYEHTIYDQNSVAGVGPVLIQTQEHSIPIIPISIWKPVMWPGRNSGGGLQFVVRYLCQCLGCCDPFLLLKTQVGQMFRVHWWVGDSASLHRDSHETHPPVSPTAVVINFASDRNVWDDDFGFLC